MVPLLVFGIVTSAQVVAGFAYAGFGATFADAGVGDVGTDVSTLRVPIGARFVATIEMLRIAASDSAMRNALFGSF